MKKYSVHAEYKSLTASTMTEAETQDKARDSAMRGIMRAISRKYPDVKPEDVKVAIGVVPDEADPNG